jgi:hypothetical protein
MAALERIVGEACLPIVAGPGTANLLVLDFGVGARPFEAPRSIHVWCSWRIERAGRVVGSRAALPDEAAAGLPLLRGRRPTSVDLGDPIPDLRLTCDDVRLTVFADTLSTNDGDCAYTLATPDEVFLVFANAALYREWSEPR